ncbi:MAG TPA: hypothetical protein VHQ99_05665 [Gaiellaceae bacterium]|jgi:hypothetical protein|nr:hypothetical protein [Gaiellaceae bacterium]
MVRPVRLIALLAVLVAVGVALAAPGSASARLTPRGVVGSGVVIVDRMSDATFAKLAKRGAVGLLRPGYGPTTNRRRALAELVRGTEVNARLGGVPAGKPLLNTNKASVYPNCHTCIVVQLPPRGVPTANNRLYRIAVIGGGFHGLLRSPTTHIPGLVSIVDIAPTALPGHPSTTLSWTPSQNAIGQLTRLDHAIGSNNRLKFAALFILAGVLLALALLGLRAAVTAVPAALLVNLALGMGPVSSEVLLCAAISAGTALVAFGLSRLCRSESALLALYGGVVVLYAFVMIARPEWQAVNPFGPTQNSRFWGIGNQIETLLLAPLLAGAFLARRRFGVLGFGLFGVFGLFVMTDNRLGADGGGAIALGLALAVLGARLFKLGAKGFVGLLGSAALAVLWIVSRGLAQPGPNHLRSAFSDDGAGLLSSLESRVPLSYLPALHAWQMVVPLLFVLAAAFALAWRFARQPSTRDLLLAFGVAIVTSLLVNDSAAYELTAGIAVVGALARFAPAPAPARAPVLVPAISRLFSRAKLEPEQVPLSAPVPSKSAPG